MIIRSNFYNEIKKVKGIIISKDVSTKNDNYLKVEAFFAYKIEVYNYFSIKKLFEIIRRYKVKYYIIGKGSNVLFANDYFNGVLIKLMPLNSKYDFIVAGGDSINYLNNRLIKKGIDTFNFLTGVPSSIGGAIYMNAGCYKKEIKDIIEYVYVFDIKDLRFKVFSNEQCEFKYRDSYFKHHNLLIIGAKVKLIRRDVETILKEQFNYLELRKSKLPLEYPNLGSIFKNPSNDYAARLIEEVGLKGQAIGGGKISEKHANVIINYNEAKYQDILDLIKLIQDKVYIKYKTNLELEIIIFK